MRDIDTALGHHFYQVLIAKLVRDVSSDAENDDCVAEVATMKQSGGEMTHAADYLYRSNSLMSRKLCLHLFFVNRLSFVARRSLRLLFLFLLLSVSLSAQESREGKYNEAASAMIEAARLFDIGSKESLRQAIQKYAEAGTLFRSINHRQEEERAFGSIAEAYKLLEEYPQAIDAHLQALKIKLELKDHKGTAITLAHIGSIYVILKDYRKSVDYYTQALPFWRAANDLRNEATSLTNLCYVYLYDELNEKQKAIESCAESLPLWQKLGDTENEAEAHYLIGLTYATMDDEEKALKPYEQALSLFRKSTNREGESKILHRMAMVYNSLGKTEKALDLYNQALRIRRDTKDLVELAATLDNMGLIYAASGNNQKAIELFEEALRLTREVEDREGEGAVLGNLGLTYYRMGENQKALEYHRKALALKQHFADRRLEASSLSDIGLVYRALGNYQEARRSYLKGLQISREVGDRTGQVNRLFNLARLDTIQNDFQAARERIEEAIALIESLRAAISDQELRTSYYSTVQDYYDLYIEILMRLHKERPSEGHDTEALQTSERRRARALLEMLVEAGADIRRGVSPELLGRERSLQQQLNAIAERQMNMLSRPHAEQQARALARELETLTTGLQQVQTEIREKSPAYAALTQPRVLSLREIQNSLLDADTVLLEYSLGREHSYLWVVTPTSIVSYELPERNIIETVARRFHYLVNSRNREIKNESEPQKDLRFAREDAELKESGAKLSHIILKPVAAQLTGKRLLVVADGALQYVPFAALPEPSQPAGESIPLVVRHEIISLPSASTLALLRKQMQGRPAAAKTVAVLADPVFETDDKRLARQSSPRTPGKQTPRSQLEKERTFPLDVEVFAATSGVREAGLTLPRLPGTRYEANQILSLVQASQSLSAFDFAANRQTATSAQLSQYRYVHFATHGFLNSVHPELSGIVLSLVNEKGESQDGFLRAHEVFNLKLPAELVVLSACQTGLGKEIKGEGLVGLTRGFMYAGAPRVVVSLWSVSDQATAELMARFYRGMLKEKMRPAAALRAAQVFLMKERGWESPYYWAAFTLQGEWR